MAAKTKTISKKNLINRLMAQVAQLRSTIRKKQRAFMERRPHRTFRLTKRRDYRAKFHIEGYIAFTVNVAKVIWKNRRLFGSFIVVYGIASALLLGMSSNDLYRDFAESLGAQQDASFGGRLVGATTLFFAAATGSFQEAGTEIQQFIAGILMLLGWLVMVWLLRQVMAGHKVALRDGFYSAGAPIVATAVIVFVMILQLLPIILGVIAYVIAQSIGLAQAGVEAMAAWAGLALLATLSLYWLTSSIIALIIITLPGMRPFAALKASGDLVLGKRLKVMGRFLWLALLVVVLWGVILIPTIMLDQWMNIAWLPLVPLMILLVTTFSIVWISTYVYLLYRRLIDEPTKSA